MRRIRRAIAYLQGIFEHLTKHVDDLTHHTDPELAAAYLAGWDLSERIVGRVLPHDD